MKTTPPPPPLDPRLRRHSMPTITRARELFEAGWTERQIQRLLHQEFGVKPAINSIKYWTDEDYRKMEMRRRKLYRQTRSKRPTPTPDPFGFSDELLLQLRVEDELTYPTISKVLRRFYNVEMDPEKVRYRLYELGAPKNENKSRSNTKRLAA